MMQQRWWPIVVIGLIVPFVARRASAGDELVLNGDFRTAAEQRGSSRSAVRLGEPDLRCRNPPGR